MTSSPNSLLTNGSRNWNRQINPMRGYAPGNLRGIQGAGNEQLVAARALKHGFIVFFKIWSDTKYDAVIDCEGELFRAQIKGSQTGSVAFTGGERGGIQRPISRSRYYTRADCDLLIGVDANNGDCYVIPIDYVTALGRIVWERYPEPNSPKNARLRSTGLAIDRRTILEMRRLV